jgi:hypothetical protein
MNSKSLIWIGMFVGSTIGGFVPILWGADFLSISSVVLTAVGGIIGIWIGFQLSN